MKEYKIVLSEVDEIILKYDMNSIQEWIDNTIQEKIKRNADSIISSVLDKFFENNIQIPSSKNEIILKAKELNFFDKKQF
jgi:hypothetical protein